MGGFDRVTVMHTSAIYEIEGILTLGEMETRGGAGDGNSEKMTERS
jgi:hypothetical protein